MPNKFSQFLKELKRRNVVYVITVYAGAAFVILSLVDMIREPFELPDWSFKLVIVILAIGFIIAVILSWIYDFRPEGGMVKTEPAHKVKDENMPKSSNSWKIASYISFIVIVGLIILNVVPRANNRKILDKSIAVLPFSNLSSDEENTYFIDAVMGSILDNLCKIEDIRVPGRTSVLQYRENPKPIPVVAEEMEVSYVLEGSGQKIGNRLLLTVQLTIGKEDRLIWSKPYDREIENVEDLIDLQKEIAEMVANEIEAIITPEEKQRIEKIPTTDLTAYDLYQRGMDYYIDFEVNNDLKALDRAESYFHEALGIDSSYANAYVGLAYIYWDKQYLSGYYVTENYLDSVPALLNLALSYDELSSEAYTLRGLYYRSLGNDDLAIKDFEKAIRLNPNDGRAYNGMARLYQYSDFVKSLELLHKSISIDRGKRLYQYLMYAGGEYFIAGFLDKAGHYYNEALKLVGDSANYYNMMAEIAAFSGEDNKAIDYSKKAILLESTSSKGYLAGALERSGKYKEALAVYESWIDDMNKRGRFDPRYAHRIAYAYSINGLTEKAEFYFDKQIEYSLAMINLNRLWAQYYFPYYDLAGVYAFRGEKESAYENLRAFNELKEVPYWMVVLIKRDPLFYSIRDEPEFQQIVRDVEVKYQASHERVRQWLEENDML